MKKIPKKYKEAIQYLKDRGGSCGWEDTTVPMCDKLYDACMAGYLESDAKTQCWVLKK